MEGDGILRWFFKPLRFTWVFLTSVKLSPFRMQADLEAHSAGQLLLVENYRFLLFGTQSSKSPPFPHLQGTLMSNWYSTGACHGLSLMIPEERRCYSPFPHAAELTGESEPELFDGAVLHSFALTTTRCLSDLWTS